MTAASWVYDLHGAIAHGDDEHRAWLLDAILAFSEGCPIPAPRGSFTLRARVADLEADLRTLRADFDRVSLELDHAHAVEKPALTAERDEARASLEYAKKESDLHHAEWKKALARANKMHRRAQHLEGVEERMATLRKTHERVVADIRKAADRDAIAMRDRERALRLRLDEAHDRLPPPNETATKLDDLAERVSGDGVPARVLNVAFIAYWLRLAAATIRTIEWERSFDRNHDLCAKANEAATAFGVERLRELDAARTENNELRAELETLRARGRDVP